MRPARRSTTKFSDRNFAVLKNLLTVFVLVLCCTALVVPAAAHDEHGTTFNASGATIYYEVFRSEFRSIKKSAYRFCVSPLLYGACCARCGARRARHHFQCVRRDDLLRSFRFGQRHAALRRERWPRLRPPISSR